MPTFSIKEKDIKREWWLIDASGKTLGRLATTIAHYLRGKHKPEFTPHMDTGDYIVVTNAEKVNITGSKPEGKTYYWHSGYPGGLKSSVFSEMLAKKPQKVIELAVKGMLPKGPLGRQMFRKLKVYRNQEHPHAAQQPQPLNIGK